MKPLLILALLAGCAPAQSTISGCPAFPANNIWNAAVNTLPVHTESAAFIAKAGPAAGLRLDDTMPINIVSRTQAKVVVSGISTPESDPNPYAIPPNAQSEGGEDSHIVVLDKDDCILYELYAGRRTGESWTAGSAAKWDLHSNALRPDGWTSADAAGLPIMPGILRYEELAAGQVNHALRITAPYTRGNGVFQWPGRHYASHNADGPPMGLRFRLKASVDISSYPANVQVVLRALKKYGAMIADNGLPWGMQHDADPRWKGVDLTALHQVLGSNMEAVDVSSLMNDSNSGMAGPAAGMVLTTDAFGRPNAIKLGPGLAIVNGALVLSPR